MAGFVLWRVTKYYFDDKPDSYYDYDIGEYIASSSFEIVETMVGIFRGPGIARKAYYDAIRESKQNFSHRDHGFLVRLDMVVLPIEGEYELDLKKGWLYQDHYFHKPEHDEYRSGVWEKEIVDFELIPQKKKGA